MLTVSSPFTLAFNSVAYNIGDRITDPDTIAAALAQAPSSVIQTACAPKPPQTDQTAAPSAEKASAKPSK
jgi:hypothetical protein